MEQTQGSFAENNKAPQEFYLPRLNIVFFCESKELYDVAGQSATDRRLKRSKISVYSGGISGAVEMYQDKPTPDLLIIESQLATLELLADLENLAEICDSHTKVMIAGQYNDVDMYRELIRQGISEYLVMPTTPIRLIESLSSIYGSADETPMARSIAFIGAVGGAGTSVIAQNFSVITSSEHHLDTCYVDLDTSYGSASMNWNMEAKKTIKDLISMGREIDEEAVKGAMTHVSENLQLLSSPITPEYTVSTSPDNDEALEEMFCSVRRLSDLVVMDIPYGELSAIKQSALMSATHIYIVSLPTVRGLRNVSILYQALCRMRPNDAPPKIIFSQIDNPDIVALNKRFIVDSLGRDADHYIRYAPQAVERSVAEGLPFADVPDGEEVALDIEACVQGFFGRTMVREKKTGLQKIISDLLKQ